MAKEIVIVRRAYMPDYTYGTLLFGEDSYHTLELPWLDNHPDHSCIPPGEYGGIYHTKEDGAHCILLEGVNGRSLIEIHAGNTVNNTKGCILVGRGASLSLSTCTVLESQDALNLLIRAIGEDFPVKVTVGNFTDLVQTNAAFANPPEAPSAS